MKLDEIKNNLNEQQLSAVESDDKLILCLAGAGTGKTYTLISRISRLILEGKCKPQNILALTFTNAASAEMSQRYTKFMSECESTRPEFRTFHSFCYSLLVKDIGVRNALGYSDIPKICTDESFNMISRQVRTQCNIKLTDSQLKSGIKLKGNDRFQYDLYNKALTKAMVAQNTITFGRLCNEVCKLFTSDSPLIKKYKERYTYIFVDEFQDTDPTQWMFVKSFIDSNIFIVGDALQALYGFRNADSTIIKKLANDEAWTTIKLYQNYRSTKQICDFANNMSKYADDSYRIAINSSKEGERVYSSQAKRPDRFISVSAEMLESVLNDVNSMEGSIAILCRQNREVTTVIDYLEDNEIELYSGSINENAKHIFKSGRDNDYMIEWLLSLMDSQTQSDWIRMCHLNNIETSDEKIKLILELCKNNKIIFNNISSIRSLRKTIRNDNLSILERCVNAFKILNIKNTLIDTDAKDTKGLIEYIESVLNANSRKDVYVGTIHSSKGLEYDNVIVLNVDTKNFPLDSEENRNCYYVAITRARKLLKIYWGSV